MASVSIFSMHRLLKQQRGKRPNPQTTTSPTARHHQKSKRSMFSRDWAVKSNQLGRRSMKTLKRTLAATLIAAAAAGYSGISSAGPHGGAMGMRGISAGGAGRFGGNQLGSLNVRTTRNGIEGGGFRRNGIEGGGFSRMGTRNGIEGGGMKGIEGGGMKGIEGGGMKGIEGGGMKGIEGGGMKGIEGGGMKGIEGGGMKGIEG